MFRQPRCASSFSFTDCIDAHGCGGLWLDLMGPRLGRGVPIKRYFLTSPPWCGMSQSSTR